MLVTNCIYVCAKSRNCKINFALFLIENDKCLPLSDPDNGKVYIILNGKVAIFTCNDGFVTVGNPYLQCIDGKWNSPPPKCQPS